MKRAFSEKSLLVTFRGKEDPQKTLLERRFVSGSSKNQWLSLGWRGSRAHQSGPVPPPQPRAGQLGGTRELSGPGTGHLWGWGWAKDGLKYESSSVEPMAGQGRAVVSWRPALLWHRWGRAGQGLSRLVAPLWPSELAQNHQQEL